MAMNKRTCPDCNAGLEEIRLIDKSDKGYHTDLQYSLPEAKRGLWLGRFPIEGRILAYMCGKCGRVILYADPTRKTEG